MTQKKTDFKTLHTAVITRLEKNLSPKLYYHGPHHTRDDVLPAAERLAQHAKLDAEQTLLLRTAALYHDIGYLEHYVDHESLGANIAAAELPKHGYTPAEVQIIVDLIMATRMPHNPRTDLEKMMCDADLNSICRDDFFITSHSLRLELKHMGLVTSVREWYTRQLKFLESHRYLSEAGIALGEDGKQQNITELRGILAQPAEEKTSTPQT
jgi:uncharacterized protein